MGDVTVTRPDHACLFGIGSEQQGYFTSAQARTCGFGRDLLAYHARSGRFIRIRHGLYRLRDYPTSPREEVMAAWLAAGKDTAVVSHVSALDLLDLSDLIPDAIHLTVPRSKRHLPNLPGVVVHTSIRPPRATDIVIRDGMRVTGATRAILDAAESGFAPEQIEMAVEQALNRGLTTARQLEGDASDRSGRVRRLIDRAISQAAR